MDAVGLQLSRASLSAQNDPSEFSDLLAIPLRIL